MAWVWLGLAAVFEVIFALAMKASNGFTKPVPTLVVAVAAGFGLWFLSIAMRTLPVGVAYPVWVGLGAVGAVAFGAILFGEQISPLKIASVAAIVAGVAGLKIASGS
ncbi:MAG: DMT family transporter [Pikeienuella sp.]|uniref:DMT family transporter n=1 Tax=Pikeienuella sp. TaxID=2831957 RepID=UPI0039196244